MTRIRKLRSWFLIYAVFLLACVRSAVSQALPRSLKSSIQQDTSKTPVGAGHLGAMGGANRGEPQFAFEATGRFPYVRIVPLADDPVPVPIEIVPWRIAPDSDGASQEHGLLHRAKPNEDDHFCLTGFCSSCSSCSSCNSCGCGSCCA
jgi:hypothetical protein